MKSRKLVKFISTVMVFVITFLGLTSFNVKTVEAYNGVTTYATTDALNVRKGPGTSYASWGTIPKNTVLAWDRVKGTTGDWVRVTVWTGVIGDNATARDGYVHRDYLKPLATTGFKKATDNLNLRNKPSTSGSIYRTASKGTNFEVYDNYRVKANGYTWIPVIDKKDYVQKIGSSNYYVLAHQWAAREYLG